FTTRFPCVTRLVFSSPTRQAWRPPASCSSYCPRSACRFVGIGLRGLLPRGTSPAMDDAEERLRRLGGPDGSLKTALDELGMRKGHVDQQVVDYCESSYVDPAGNRREVWMQTEEYLKDALGSVAADIEAVALKLTHFIDAQAAALDHAAEDLGVVKTRLQRSRDQSAAKRLLSLRARVDQPPARQKIVVLNGEERPKRCRPLAPFKRVPLAEKLDMVYKGKDEVAAAGAVTAQSNGKLSPKNKKPGDGGGGGLAGLGLGLGLTGLGPKNGSNRSLRELGGLSLSSSRLSVSELPSPDSSPLRSVARSPVSPGGRSPLPFRSEILGPPLGDAAPAASGLPGSAGCGGGGGDRARADGADTQGMSVSGGYSATSTSPAATVAPPPLAPPPPARDSRLARKIPGPGGSRLSGPPQLLSKAKLAPPPLLSPTRSTSGQTSCRS
ncbi:unnamed protein product, partial [Discosporangium mesarthrocarpum]